MPYDYPRRKTIPRIKEARLSNSYSQINTDSGTVSATPESTLSITGAGGITVSGVDGSPDAITINSSNDVSAHSSDTTIHFLESDIDHTAIQNIGTNTHAQIDTHLSPASGVHHFLESDIDHGAINGLNDDDHTQYHNDTRGDARYYTESEIDIFHTALSAKITASGITNGDSHDHSGGDGAQIDHTTLSNIGTDSHVTIDSHIDNSAIHFTTAGVDHGVVSGLADNDHPQYLLVTDIDDTPINGEIAQPISSNWAFDHVAAVDPHTGYRLESADHSHQSTGAQAGKIDHGLALNGLTDDDHSQYHTDARGDARYYTETELDAGQLDNRYYTETEVDTIASGINHGDLENIGTDDHHAQSHNILSHSDTTGTTASGVSLVELTDGSETVLHSHAGGAGDHGGLTGLADDDHTQYLLEDGSRNLSGSLALDSTVVITSADEDLTFNFGKMLIGDFGLGSTFVGFSHRALAEAAGTYAFLQKSDGASFVNSSSVIGTLQYNATAKFTWGSTAITSLINHDFSAGIDVTGDGTFTGDVGIGTTSPDYPLQVIGTNGHINIATSETNITNKTVRISNMHYTSAEEPLGLIFGSSTSTTGLVCLGGGSSIFNAATEVRFYTAANNTTVTGTRRMVIDSAGLVGIGVNTPLVNLHIGGLNPQFLMKEDDNHFFGIDVDIPTATQTALFTDQARDLVFGAKTNADDAALSETWVTFKGDGDIIVDAMQQYISVTYTADNTAQAGTHTIFNTTTYGGTVVTNTSNGITFSATTGEFTITKAGTYKIDIVVNLESSTSSNLLTILRLNKNSGTIVWDANSGILVHSSVDPAPITISVILDFAASDTIELECDSLSTATIKTNRGSTFNIMRIA